MPQIRIPPPWQIAERHGGRAWVEPRQGGGSVFTVTFAAERGRAA